jgi:type IV pilus assembly protein PilA
MITSNYSSRIKRRDEGFTLVEILIAIVVVGVLAAVAIVGINSLTETGSDSACTASADAATAASAAYFAANGNSWPTGIEQMVDGGQFVAPSDATFPTSASMKVGGWTLTLSPQAGVGPKFVCS